MSQELKLLISRIIKAGYQISPDAYDYLQKVPSDYVEKIITVSIKEASKSRDGFLVIDKPFMEAVSEQEKAKGQRKKPKKKEILSLLVKTDIQLINDEIADPAADVAGFKEYFRSRFESINSILKRRIDARESITFERVGKLPLKTQVKIIGIVTHKRTRGDRLFLEVEDLENTITVLASDPEVVRNGLQIQQDQVICIESIKYKEDLLIANNLIWPDIPAKTPSRSQEPICVALLADIHVGSNFFRNDLFDRFIDWLNLESESRSQRELASRIKYIIIAGDLIDGVGVYPDQIKELKISTLSEQYKEASKILKEVPDYIEILIVPGNHDAVRKSLPQPPIPKKYCSELYEDPRIHLYQNPCQMSLNGVDVLLSHGKALDDILSTTPSHDFHNPTKAIKVLLRARHLAPSYGLSTPIAPEKKDRLVINRVPDLLHMGHIHIHETTKYKGTTIVASGTFQDQTPFQKRMKIKPSPGVLSIFDLQTHKLAKLDLRGVE
jgi:DNA polymerase II small subunit